MPSSRAYAPVIGSMTDSGGLSGFEPRSEAHDEHVVEEADTAAGSRPRVVDGASGERLRRERAPRPRDEVPSGAGVQPQLVAHLTPITARSAVIASPARGAVAVGLEHLREACAARGCEHSITLWQGGLLMKPPRSVATGPQRALRAGGPRGWRSAPRPRPARSACRSRWS